MDGKFIAEFGEDANLDVVPIYRKTAALKHKKKTRLTFDDHFKLTKGIGPQSDEIGEVLEKQRAILSDILLLFCILI